MGYVRIYPNQTTHVDDTFHIQILVEKHVTQ